MIDPFDPYYFPDAVLDELSSEDRFEEVIRDCQEHREDPFGDDLYFNLPSKERFQYWITDYNPLYGGVTYVYSGKWLIFLPPSEVDSGWDKIKKSLRRGALGYAAKVSTRLAFKGGDYVVCVYTKDHRNKQDVMRVREELRRLGFTQKLPYKTDCATRKGEYSSTGKKVSKYYE